MTNQQTVLYLVDSISVDRWKVIRSNGTRDGIFCDGYFLAVSFSIVLVIKYVTCVVVNFGLFMENGAA